MTWNDVVGYEEYYEVSDEGCIRSKDRKYVDSIGRHTCRKGHILHPVTTNLGYQRVTLVKNKSNKSYFLHDLVASAFVPNPNNYKFVNHKDENKKNNHVDNLEWCSSKYNANYGTRNERMRKKLSESNKLSRPILAITKDGAIEHYKSIREAERILNYPHTGISNMLNGRTNTACGRIWKYEED